MLPDCAWICGFQIHRIAPPERLTSKRTCVGNGPLSADSGPFGQNDFRKFVILG